MIISSVTPKVDPKTGTVQKTHKDLIKYSVICDGAKFTGYGDWLLDKVGVDAMYKIKDEEFMGVQYKTIWPLENAVSPIETPKVAETTNSLPLPKYEDPAARGKVRNSMAEAMISSGKEFNRANVLEAELWTEWVMSGEYKEEL